MSEEDEDRELYYGFQSDTLNFLFASSEHVWIASVSWNGGYKKSKDYVSDYDGRIDLHGIRREIETIGALTINAVRMWPTRYSTIRNLTSSLVQRENLKGGRDDTSPWFFRKPIPPLKFNSLWMHGEARFKTVMSSESDEALTPTQKGWVEEHVVTPLDRSFTLQNRAEFLWEAKRAYVARFKDGLLSDAMLRMVHFRNLAEAIENDYDSLVIHPDPTPAP